MEGTRSDREPSPTGRRAQSAVQTGRRAAGPRRPTAESRRRPARRGCVTNGIRQVASTGGRLWAYLCRAAQIGRPQRHMVAPKRLMSGAPAPFGNSRSQPADHHNPFSCRSGRWIPLTRWFPGRQRRRRRRPRGVPAGRSPVFPREPLAAGERARALAPARRPGRGRASRTHSSAGSCRAEDTASRHQRRQCESAGSHHGHCAASRSGDLPVAQRRSGIDQS